MNKKFLVLVVIGALVSLATYFGLNIAKPYKKHEDAAEKQVTVEEVFSAGLSDAPKGVAAAEQASPEVAAAAAVPAPAEEAAPAAEEVPTTESAPAPAAESAAPGAEEAAAPAAEPAAAEPEPEAAPAPAEPPKARPAPKAATPKAATPKAELAPAPKPAAPKAPAAQAAWWPKNDDPSKLGLTTATSASDKKAVVLGFDGGFDDSSSADASIEVLDTKGAKVDGKWEVSSRNKNVLFFQVGGSGRYTVVIKAGLKDRTGRTLVRGLRGPVQVK